MILLSLFSLPDNFRQQNKTLQLVEHFFNPRVIESEEVFDGLLRGFATQTSQKMDISLIPDVSMTLNFSHKKTCSLADQEESSTMIQSLLLHYTDDKQIVH